VEQQSQRGMSLAFRSIEPRPLFLIAYMCSGESTRNLQRIDNSRIRFKEREWPFFNPRRHSRPGALAAVPRTYTPSSASYATPAPFLLSSLASVRRRDARTTGRRHEDHPRLAERAARRGEGARQGRRRARRGHDAEHGRGRGAPALHELDHRLRPGGLGEVGRVAARGGSAAGRGQ
jgi:hypothetical protein